MKAQERLRECAVLLEQSLLGNNIRAAARDDFQQCGMCDQQSFNSACAYAQSDQSLCMSLEYFMTLRLLIEHHLEFLTLKVAAQARSSLHLSKYHICGNHMPRLINQ